MSRARVAVTIISSYYLTPNNNSHRFVRLLRNKDR